MLSALESGMHLVGKENLSPHNEIEADHVFALRQE